MGVFGLGPFIRSQEIDCEFVIELSSFSGTSWGIDSLNWIFRDVPITVKNIINTKANIFEPITDDEIRRGVEKKMYFFNKKLADHGITPVWIWDGVSQGNKVLTQEERREKRRENLEKRKALFEKLSEKDILELTDEEIKKWKNSVCSSTGLSRESVGKLKTLTREFGIPTITSDDEAENLAASLSVEKKISLVWSNDTDNYPLGSTKVASEFIYKEGKVYVKGIEPHKIVSHLGMDFRTFRDFCILMGTDFNKRIKGFGPTNNLKLLKKYGCLEKIDSDTKHNFSFINYPYVRKQLTPYSTYYQKEIHLCTKKCYDPDKLQDLKDKYPELNVQSLISSLNDLCEDEESDSEESNSEESDSEETNHNSQKETLH